MNQFQISRKEFNQSNPSMGKIVITVGGILVVCSLLGFKFGEALDRSFKEKCSVTKVSWDKHHPYKKSCN